MTLGPRYKALGSIASGGMGNVVLAHRKDGSGSARPVAIKQLHAHLVHDPQMVAMFIDEARITARLDHPNVVGVQDVEMVGEHLVIVMDYVEGVSLKELLDALRARGATLPIGVARRILVDALAGLHAAHELHDDAGRPLGLVHRDVSPHNLLVATDGVTRVTDFGVAMATGRLASTQADGVKGKLQYLSPEQIYRRSVDRRADVFAAGIVLWECLTGRKLFWGASEGETLAAVLREPIAPPSTHRPDVPLDLDETCLRALERDPSRRFASADALARALAEGPLAAREEVAALVESLASSVLASHRAMLAAAGPDSNGAFAHVVEGAPSTPAALARDARTTTPRGRHAGLTLAAGALVVGSLVGGGLVWVGRPAAATSTAAEVAPFPSASPEPAPAATASSPPSAEATSAATSPAASAVAERSAPRPRDVARPSGKARSKRAVDAGHGGRPFMPDDL